MARGRKPGIYHTWAECQREVNGFNKPLFKGFNEFSAAKDWLERPNFSPQKVVSKKAKIAEKKFALHIWTDGGSRNHGNKKGQHVKSDDKAAWAYLIDTNTQRFFDSAGEYGATNNRMEVMALLQALKKIKEIGKNKESICATLDSRYVLDALQKGWLRNWEKRGWKTASGSAVANQKLWAEVLSLLSVFPNLTYEWTKGHRNNEGNVFVDKLLNETMDKL
ncbi:RNase HI [Liquorilactobacillus oeni DSM 19972]|uniref:ribonuclease H n=1 Tax=Liquorilactobacillus oeni DSM 19972 TaxID=1423777 RepID=A0A0R1MDL7_9LACO|nr:RNase HI [Liquorilactobacillus oeni DSM 19972]